MGGKNLHSQYYRNRNLKHIEISPYDQRAFAKAISFGAPNLLKRFLKKVWIIPVLYMGEYFRQWVIWDLEDSKRKYRLEEFQHLYQEEGATSQ